MAVLITGASRGIGRATAVELGESRPVAVNYRTDEAGAAETVDEIEALGGRAVAVQGDVSDPESAAELVDRAETELGELQAVVNNAGIVRPARLEEMSDDAWRTVLETNLSGAFYVTRAATRSLRDADGDVVMVSSIGGTGGTVDVAYAASKAGLHGLTRALARELGPAGVQVNAVAPGPVATSMNDDIVGYLESEEFHGHENADTHLPTYACDPDAVADSVAYLLDNEFVHGEVLSVNGGMQFR